MPTNSGIMRLSKKEDGIIVNKGDYIGDDLEALPPVIQEMRDATIDLSLNLFRQGGGNQPTKVRPFRQKTGEAPLNIGQVIMVTGYITLLKNLWDRTPRDMEGILGVGAPKFANGVEVFVIIDPLRNNQFAPRYTTQWAGGVSPRDLANQGARYHPNYPPASSPVYQWAIYRNTPARAIKVATLSYNELFVCHSA